MLEFLWNPFLLIYSSVRLGTAKEATSLRLSVQIGTSPEIGTILDQCRAKILESFREQELISNLQSFYFRM